MGKDKVKFYKDEAREWRWSRLDMGNYKEVGAASEGYVRYADCFSNAFDQFGDTVDYDKPTFAASGDPDPSHIEIND